MSSELNTTNTGWDEADFGAKMAKMREGIGVRSQKPESNNKIDSVDSDDKSNITYQVDGRIWHTKEQIRKAGHEKRGNFFKNLKEKLDSAKRRGDEIMDYVAAAPLMVENAKTVGVVLANEAKEQVRVVVEKASQKVMTAVDTVNQAGFLATEIVINKGKEVELSVRNVGHKVEDAVLKPYVAIEKGRNGFDKRVSRVVEHVSTIAEVVKLVFQADKERGLNADDSLKKRFVEAVIVAEGNETDLERRAHELRERADNRVGFAEMVCDVAEDMAKNNDSKQELKKTNATLKQRLVGLFRKPKVVVTA